MIQCKVYTAHEPVLTPLLHSGWKVSHELAYSQDPGIWLPYSDSHVRLLTSDRHKIVYLQYFPEEASWCLSDWFHWSNVCLTTQQSKISVTSRMNYLIFWYEKIWDALFWYIFTILLNLVVTLSDFCLDLELCRCCVARCKMLVIVLKRSCSTNA